MFGRPKKGERGERKEEKEKGKIAERALPLKEIGKIVLFLVATI
jgi:hypothetical protein